MSINQSWETFFSLKTLFLFFTAPFAFFNRRLIQLITSNALRIQWVTWMLIAQLSSPSQVDLVVCRSKALNMQSVFYYTWKLRVWLWDMLQYFEELKTVWSLCRLLTDWDSRLSARMSRKSGKWKKFFFSYWNDRRWSSAHSAKMKKKEEGKEKKKIFV